MSWNELGETGREEFLMQEWLFLTVQVDTLEVSMVTEGEVLEAVKKVK